MAGPESVQSPQCIFAVFQEEFDKEFKQKIGYTRETRAFWPGAGVVKVLIKKLEILVGGIGLTRCRKEGEGSGDTTLYKPLANSLLYKFYNNTMREQRRLEREESGMRLP